MRNRFCIYLFFPALFALLFSCDDHSKHSGSMPNGDSMADMHGMASMPGMTAAPENHSDMLQLSERDQLLAGINIDTIRMNKFSASVTALGKVAVDESTVSVISSKVKGRIEHLYLRNPGDEIHRGQALYDLYSEELLAEENDLLQLVHFSQNSDLIDASRNKLKLYGLSDDQVSHIEKQNSASPTITIYSLKSGFLSELPVREGQYVETGDLLFEIASLDFVRINALVYPDEIELFNNASGYEVETGLAPGKTYSATRILDNPALESGSKIQFVRLRIANTDHLLRPGMMITVRAITPSEHLLTIPKTALISESGMTFSWIRGKDGMFSRKMIETGKENEKEIEVISGLTAGDLVVTTGVYLLNSEYILRKGANSMSGMKM